MANFYSALEALSSGQTSLESISLQLKQILAQNPDHSYQLRNHLFQARNENIISGNIFDRLNNIIEPYLLDTDETAMPAANAADVFISIDDRFPNEELTTGKVIKHRFQLMEILGVGGMGRVYKGIDLLKQEAQDKDPYVAIKLLNEDFKHHPKAFISLQRESSRQQKLAHPNIATVYDFDRVGGPGTPVFIIMELLEGQTLNTFIKTRLRRIGGLPFSEAIKIIRQLSAALSYAHERGVVHSDFKPGNAFVCLDGTVKVLDFGIARAVTNPIEGDSERTLFDPRNLGAFTPAYASLEMLQGMEPDPRDDIYALGCVAYELLTGKHPYDKLPANKVKEQNITYQPIKGLKRRQNKTLEQALSCDRDTRCQSVEHFIDELEAKYVWYRDVKTVAFFVFLALGISLLNPIKNQLQQQKIARITEDLLSEDTSRIESSLREINQLDAIERLSVSNTAKDTIQEYYATQIAQLIDVSTDDYDFIEANTVLGKIENIYPDSNFLQIQKVLVEKNKEVILNKLYLQLSEQLNNKLTVIQSIDILEKITKKINPQHALLKDQAIINSYYAYAFDAYKKDDLAFSEELIDRLLSIFNEQKIFFDLKQTLTDQQQLSEAKIALEGLVFDQLDNINQATIEHLKTLSVHQPDWEEYLRIRESVQQAIDLKLSQIESSGNRQQAETLLRDQSTLLESLGLFEELTQLKLLHLKSPQREQAIAKLNNKTIKRLNLLISKPQPNASVWNSEIKSLMDILETLSETDNKAQQLVHYRLGLADLFMNQAKLFLAEQRYSKANDSIEQAVQYMPFSPDVRNTQIEIQQAFKSYSQELELAALKKEFELKVDGNDIEQAETLLKKLRTYIPDNDYFLVRYAPKRLSQSHQQLAEIAFDREKYPEALIHADDGLQLYPYNDELKQLKGLIQIELHSKEITETMNQALSFDYQLIREKFGVIERVQPSRYLQLRQDTIQTLKQRIRTLAVTDSNQALTLAQNALLLFPGSSIGELVNNLKPNAWPNYQNSMNLLAQGKLSEATRVAANTEPQYQQHPDYLSFIEMLNLEKDNAQTMFSSFQTSLQRAGSNRERLIEAQALLQQAQSLWVDNTNYQQQSDNLNQRLATVAPKTIPIPDQSTDIQQANVTSPPQETLPSSNSWRPRPSGQECESQYAAYGRRARAICYDLVNDDWRGPLMVVIPSGQKTQEFAISKYEITISDYSKYCALTQRCRPVGDKQQQNLPQTGISLEQAREYTAWLSERTGKRYRLPTLNEWQHAATAAGKQPDSDMNCRLQVGDDVIKGMEIMTTRSGKSNGWGLKNYLGNAQEFVLQNNTLLAAGGAYSDNQAKCTISFTRKHNGKADAITGFRVVLEDIRT